MAENEVHRLTNGRSAIAVCLAVFAATTVLSQETTLEMQVTHLVDKREYAGAVDLLHKAVIDESTDASTRQWAARQLKVVARNCMNRQGIHGLYLSLYRDEAIQDQTVLAVLLEEIVNCCRRADSHLAGAREFLREEAVSAKGNSKEVAQSLLGQLDAVVEVAPATRSTGRAWGGGFVDRPATAAFDLYVVASEREPELAQDILRILTTWSGSSLDMRLAVARLLKKAGDMSLAADQLAKNLATPLYSGTLVEALTESAGELLLIYIEQEHKDEGMKAVQEYLKLHSDDDGADKLLKAILPMAKGTWTTRDKYALPLRDGLRRNMSTADKEALCNWCIDHLPESEMAVSALEELSPSADLLRRVASEKKQTKVGRYAQEKLADSLMGQEEYDEAAQLYAAVLESEEARPSRKRILSNLAEACEKADKLTEAEASYWQLLAEFGYASEPVQALVRVAGLYEDTKQYAHAAALLQAIIAKYPGAGSVHALVAWKRLGKVQHEQSNFEEASIAYIQAAGLIRKTMAFDLATLLEAAKGADELAAKKKAEFWSVYIQCAETPEEGEIAELEQLATEVDSKEAAEAHYLLAAAYLDQREVELALSHVGRAASLAPGSSPVSDLKGKISSLAHESGLVDTNLKEYKKIAESASGAEAAKAKFEIGRLLMEKRDYKGALQWFDRVAKDHPNSDLADNALNEAAYICGAKLQDKKRMVHYYRRLVTLYPESELAYRAMQILEREGGIE